MASDCIFCKIVAGEIPASKVFESDEILAFHDIAPVAPVHVLLIPKKHIASLQDLGEEDLGLMGNLAAAAQHVAREKGVAESGYRLLTNSGKDAGQIVCHLHWHLIGGKPLGKLG